LIIYGTGLWAGLMPFPSPLASTYSHKAASVDGNLYRGNSIADISRVTSKLRLKLSASQKIGKNPTADDMQITTIVHICYSVLRLILFLTARR